MASTGLLVAAVAVLQVQTLLDLSPASKLGESVSPAFEEVRALKLRDGLRHTATGYGYGPATRHKAKIMNNGGNGSLSLLGGVVDGLNHVLKGPCDFLASRLEDSIARKQAQASSTPMRKRIAQRTGKMLEHMRKAGRKSPAKASTGRKSVPWTQPQDSASLYYRSKETSAN